MGRPRPRDANERGCERHGCSWIDSEDECAGVGCFDVYPSDARLNRRRGSTGEARIERVSLSRPAPARAAALERAAYRPDRWNSHCASDNPSRNS